LTLRNRIVMAPLTRARCGEARVPGPLVATYYEQRASAGLILTEATSVTPLGVGYAGTPGIWSDEQVDGWRRTTEAVHWAGGLIFLQLWHVGRVSDPAFLDGATPVSASPVALRGHVSLMRPKRAYVEPRALALEDIPQVVEAYRRGAENARRAGFDGVEIHGANGYLPDQFLQDSTNLRDDAYGGSVANRARLLLEIVDAAISVWGPERVGLHLAPRGDANDMGDSDPAATFGYVAQAMRARRLGFLFVREHEGDGGLGGGLRAEFDGVYVANERLDRGRAEALVRTGEVDAVAFGRAFISNPDLPRRLRERAPLTHWDPTTFYTPGAHGLIDNPFLSQEALDAE
jgi:2,4-dienoyl-CoA reductase-like NADH-dependent reductase (Old Yellow Enzyme family)